MKPSLALLCHLAFCLIQAGFSEEVNNTIPDPPLSAVDAPGHNQQPTENGSYERNDVRGEDEATRLGVQFLLSRRNPSSFGWGAETHRALTTLALAGALPSQAKQDNEQKLMVKEMELRLAVALAKQHQEELSAGQLALHVNALLGLCYNPRDFYGLNLVAKLYHKDDARLSYPYGLQSLALCNAGAAYTKARVLKLIEYIKVDPSEHGGFVDSLAMVTLALACGLKYHPMPPAERYLQRAVEKIKTAQKPDGSFGNIYSSGIALQALVFAEASDKNWNRTSAREYIFSQQKEDGSFQDFMGTYFALPLILNRTFGSLSNWSCGDVDDSHVVSPVTPTPSPENNRTKIHIGLKIRAAEVQEYRIDLAGYQKDNLYTILISNPETVSVEFKEYSFGHMIISVDGLNQDPKNNKYWLIYIVDKDGKETSATTGVDGIIPEDGANYIFELKQFAS